MRTRRSKPAAPSAEDVELLRLLFRAQHAVAQALEPRLEKVGLSATKLLVLERLALAKVPLSLGQLAVFASCAKSNITQMIDRLEDDGLVTRKPDPEDRRAVLAVLTPKGQARCEEGLALQREFAAETFAALGPEGRAELRARLALLLKRLT